MGQNIFRHFLLLWHGHHLPSDCTERPVFLAVKQGPMWEIGVMP